MKGIYQYIDLKTGNVVYVGKDSHIDKNKRHRAHLSPAYYDEQVINRVLQNNPERYEYEVIYAGNFDDDLLNVLEINTIADEQPKFNFTAGGDGVSGYRHTEEAKNKMSEAKKRENLSEETKKKLSLANIGENNPMYGRRHSEETKKKMSENHADVSGENHPNAKYSLWDVTFVRYNKNILFQYNREPNPCKCFSLRYNGKYVPIGGFYDFLTVEIINELIQEAIQNDEQKS